MHWSLHAIVVRFAVVMMYWMWGTYIHMGALGPLPPWGPHSSAWRPQCLWVPVGFGEQRLPDGQDAGAEQCRLAGLCPASSCIQHHS